MSDNNTKLGPRPKDILDIFAALGKRAEEIRSKNKFGPRPKGIIAVAERIEAEKTPCTCNNHQPELFLSGKCEWKHEKVVDFDEWRNVKIPEVGKLYEALDLADGTIRYHLYMETELAPSQERVLEKWHRIRTQPDSSIDRLDCVNGAEVQPVEPIRKIINIFQEVFLTGLLEDRVDFEWTLNGL